MKLKTIIISTVFVILVFQSNLFPLITSRIEGTILDMSNGLPISNAKVALFKCFVDYGISCDFTRYIETDNNGKFKFDDVLEGEYFLSVFKEGYAAFGPLFQYYKIFHGLSYSAPHGSWIHDRPGEIERFSIKQGQIKHFVLKLEKEAILKVKISYKMPEGTAKHPTILNRITINHQGFFDKEVTYINKIPAEYQTSYFKEGLASIEIKPFGYPIKKYEDILLEKGKVKTIDYILDFTTGQIIHGFIRDKLTKEPLQTVKVIISDPITDEISSIALTNNDGEFWIGGINPGKYSLWITYSRTKEIDHDEIIAIKKDERKVIIREF